ncbi:MAG TPA: hypothetical protein VHP83_02740 [Aggregatilineaceae bacterium]|nr:hypothetical protein [Aggregatilineaceae bacterium]
MVSKIRKPTRASQRILLGFAVFLILIAVMVVVMQIIVTFNRRTTSDFGDKIGNLCNPVDSGTPINTNYPGYGPFPLKTLVIDMDTILRSSWQDKLPAEWKATSSKDVGLVMCVESVKFTDFSCYTGNDGEPYRSLDRLEFSGWKVVMINPESGKRIINMLFSDGDTYYPCSGGGAVEGYQYMGFSSKFRDKVEPYIRGKF